MMNAIDPSAFVDVLRASRPAAKVPYYLFYSGLWDGYVTDPALMVVPFDDHLVHRGDGVFESFKCVEGAAYNLDAHLQRLLRSAHQVGLTVSKGPEALRAKVLEVLKAAGQPECSVRVILARGPGGMGVAPAESPRPVLYILVYGAGRPFMERKPQGAALLRSRIPVKPPFFATVKICNYMANALMAQEARDREADFVVGVDESGHITEGAVENVGIVTHAGRLVFPQLDTVLAGTTMLRVAELARQLETDGRLNAVVFRPIREEELAGAAEILAVGMTLNVASVVSYEGRPVGDGTPGPVGSALNELLLRDTRENPSLRTHYL